MSSRIEEESIESWRPSASLEHLALRAEMLAKARAFFRAHGVMEVETPILCQATVSDPNIQSLHTHYTPPYDAADRMLYLHTSPEFAMKRLLASGSGAIYQITKVFRDGEEGRLHNPEFTMIEWYRPGIDYVALMDEVEMLVSQLTGTVASQRLTYAEGFRRQTGFDPHDASVLELRNYALAHGFKSGNPHRDDRDTYLDFILVNQIAPTLGKDCLTFIYDYPASQAILADISPANAAVSERFELFMGGIEIANGASELTDPAEHRRRFNRDLSKRRQGGSDAIPWDERYLAAVDSGLPPCAGVALGFDRLVMVHAGVSDVADVLPFPVGQA